MKRLETYKYDIAQCFVTALLYDDRSGIDCNEDIKRLDAFLKDIEPSQDATMVFNVPDAYISFERCDITGLMADCITLEVVYFAK